LTLDGIFPILAEDFHLFRLEAAPEASLESGLCLPILKLIFSPDFNLKGVCELKGLRVFRGGEEAAMPNNGAVAALSVAMDAPSSNVSSGGITASANEAEGCLRRPEKRRFFIELFMMDHATDAVDVERREKRLLMDSSLPLVGELWSPCGGCLYWHLRLDGLLVLIVVAIPHEMCFKYASLFIQMMIAIRSTTVKINSSSLTLFGTLTALLCISSLALLACFAYPPPSRQSSAFRFTAKERVHDAAAADDCAEFGVN
jgi:hypothetical protein